MNNLTLLQFEKTEIRTTTDESGERWFVLRDVLEAIQSTTKKHCRGVEYRLVVDSLGRKQEVRAIREPDLYHMLMNSRSPKAKIARDAMIAQIRDVKHILESIRDFEVPDDLPDMFVYAIRDRETGHIKLGISRDPRARVAQLQTGNSHELELVAYRRAENRFADEHAIHADAEAYRLRGEWFTASALEVLQ